MRRESRTPGPTGARHPSARPPAASARRLREVGEPCQCPLRRRSLHDEVAGEPASIAGPAPGAAPRRLRMPPLRSHAAACRASPATAAGELRPSHVVTTPPSSPDPGGIVDERHGSRIRAPQLRHEPTALAGRRAVHRAEDRHLRLALVATAPRVDDALVEVAPLRRSGKPIVPRHRREHARLELRHVGDDQAPIRDRRARQDAAGAAAAAHRRPKTPTGRSPPRRGCTPDGSGRPRPTPRATPSRWRSAVARASCTRCSGAITG